jgi:dynein light intermediate chain 1
LGVWILDGDVTCSSPLLRFAIKPDTIENTILILVASMTQPWSLLSTLKKWITLIEEHIERLKIDPTCLRELRDRIQYDFQHYIEPNDSSMMMISSSSSSTTLKNGISAGRIPTSLSSVSIASTTTPASLNNNEEQVVLPLPEGVLTKSIGIPIIVVITKVYFI